MLNFGKYAPVSRKILAQAFAALFMMVLVFLSAKQGGIPADTSAELSGGLSIIGGLVAGWFVRDPNTSPPEIKE